MTRGGRSRRWLKRMRFYAKQRRERAVKRAVRRVKDYIRQRMDRDRVAIQRDILLYGCAFLDAGGSHIPQSELSPLKPAVVLRKSGDYSWSVTPCGETGEPVHWLTSAPFSSRT